MIALLFALLLQDKVGTRHFVDPNDLPKGSKSVLSTPKIIRDQGRAPLKVPPGFTIEPFAEGMFFPRNMAVCPNGDVLVVEAEAIRVILLRDADGDGKAETKRLFCSGLRGPHGIAVRGNYVYVANTGNVFRYPYTPGSLKPDDLPDVIIDDIPSLAGYNMHWTRNIAFSPDGKRLFVTIGSASNDDIEPFPRSTIVSYDADGLDRQPFASGMRNPVGLAFRPGTNELWASVIERDFMGDKIPPDFVTRVKQGQFFGFPWFYIGNHPDPKHVKNKPPRTDVTVPDLLVEAHSTPIGLCFYDGAMFPPEYRGDMFLAMRGSTNVLPRTGYKVVRVDFRNGKLDPHYEDFVVGWVPDRMKSGVFGRPAAVAVAKDGALLIADESGHTIWRVARKK